MANMGLRLTQLPDVNIRIKEMPEVRLAITEIPKIYMDTNSKMDIHLKEIPDIRMHLPANFTVGFSILGLQLFSIDLCGEAQVITEKYRPSRLEIC